MPFRLGKKLFYMLCFGGIVGFFFLGGGGVNINAQKIVLCGDFVNKRECEQEVVIAK